MTKSIFKILLLAGGIFVAWLGGRAVAKTVWFRAAGTEVEGKVIGFRGRGSSKAILDESSGVRKGSRRARRPVVQYPVSAGATDSMTLWSSAGVLFTFSNYEIGEAVPVVFLENHPADAQIWGFQVLLTNFLILLVGGLMIWMGAGGRL